MALFPDDAGAQCLRHSDISAFTRMAIAFLHCRQPPMNAAAAAYATMLMLICLIDIFAEINDGHAR